MTTKKKGPVGRLPNDLHMMVESYAKQNGYSMNTVIIMALRQFLDDKQVITPDQGPAA